MPGDTRWNSAADCLELYIKNWIIIANLDVPKNIENKIIDMNLKKNAEEFLKPLTPIAIALDKLQSNRTKINQSVNIWKNLKKELWNGRTYLIKDTIKL